ncbi:DUF4956 domain-containing protein [Actinomyces sp. Z5]|uniref:DUF4956 domain-containing protein n=1 Tax=Actinomyces succiniciruminis TaxID=1522002 RepID=A0A1L7RIF3_9ACTO|nr:MULTISPECIES: DUF4956 domain-containing protein [Actinomyces]RAX24686.1 DUF4956 domain-containing protein [Actinomyces sp. Z5]CED90579.1 Hypothetical protein AAM4_0747 [Actinomyces succiniciruminis]
MSPSTLAYIAVDLVALVVLVGALYTRRHARKDLVAAYAGVNVGVLAVTLLLSTASVGAGLGLGLFGVLSIIRLRSTELAQHEVAYFFAALALGLLGGITAAPLALTALLMALVVASLWIGDHPALMRRSRHQIIMLDRAITDEDALIAHLEQLLDAQVRSVEVQRLDLVDDTTLVDVRFRLHPAGHSRATTASAQPAASAPAPAPAPPSAPSSHASRPQHAAAAAPTDTADYVFPPVVQPVAQPAGR